MERFDGVAVVTKANVHCHGKCMSHTVVFPDGTRKSVGVILPGKLVFTTTAPEVMETVAGSCRYRLAGGEWRACGEGESFAVPGNSSFEIEVESEPYHYVCHFG